MLVFNQQDCNKCILLGLRLMCTWNAQNHSSFLSPVSLATIRMHIFEYIYERRHRVRRSFDDLRCCICVVFQDLCGFCLVLTALAFSLSQITEIARFDSSFFHLTFTCENKHNFDGNLNPRRRR